MSDILVSGDDGCVGTVDLEVAEPFSFNDTYQWSITSQPAGANASLSSETGQNVQLTMPIAGCYKVKVTRSSIE